MVEVYTDTPGATPPLDGGRSLGNKVSVDFEGFVDCWASAGATTFATNMAVDAGMAWPRISEGVTTGHWTPSYDGLTVDDYLSLGDRHINYRGRWEALSAGRSGGPVGPCYNGAYLWLNDPANFSPEGYPTWPYSTEINVWNRSDNGIPAGTTRFADYHDVDGRYEVSGRQITVAGDTFYAYYVILAGADRHHLTLTTTALLRHLRSGVDRAIDGSHRLVEICVAAEGHAGFRGRFVADIATMGRP